jgi:hypothetical protein
MWRFSIVVVAACSSSDAAPTAATALRPLAIAGPYPSLKDSCLAAAPCGDAIDDKTGKPTKSTAKPECGVVLDPANDLYANEGNGKRTPLVHTVGGAELHVGAVGCAVPEGLHFDHARYSMFVKRADGWWRAGPLFDFDVNNKYCGGSLLIRWNDKPGRTFAGIMAGSSCVACTKQGSQDDAIEMMVRVETAGAKPVVFPPVVVGERYTVEPNKDKDPEVNCKPVKDRFSMKESWSSDDELELAGPASWYKVTTDDNVIHVGLGGDKTAPSTAGRYRFTR